jgi:lipoprotein-anchoring transpeptidase ErfK/SrfK
MRWLARLLSLLVLCAGLAGGTAVPARAEPAAPSTLAGPGARSAPPLVAVPVPQVAQVDGGASIRVNLSQLVAQALVGSQVRYTAPITAGTPSWPTPTGTFRILRRVYSETMDSASIGIPHDAPGGYYLQGVLYTQYFTPNGNALHYNYWSPPAAFGSATGSHGCVGLQLDAAAYFWNFATVGTPVVIAY